MAQRGEDKGAVKDGFEPVKGQLSVSGISYSRIVRIVYVIFI